MPGTAIILVYDHFYPDYSAGGPVTSLANLAMLLRDGSIRILTSSLEYRSGKRMENIEVNQWTSWNNIPVWYAEGKKSIRQALSFLPENSTLYLNGLFSFRYFLGLIWYCRHRGFNVVISPRGMLQDGAMSHGYLKKKLFLSAVKGMGLFRNVHWHATDTQEAEDILHEIGSKWPISIIQNVPRSPTKEAKQIRKEVGKLRLVYFSLISRKKNLHFLLDLLLSKELQGVELDIIGPIKDKGYWEDCAKLIQRIPNPERIMFRGEINPRDIEIALSDYHALVLPTLGENFGHSIIEMLACSRPVMISDKTPWNDISKFGAGYALELNREKWIDAFGKMLAWDQNRFDSASSAALSYYHSKFDLDQLKMQYSKLFSLLP